LRKPDGALGRTVEPLEVRITAPSKVGSPDWRSPWMAGSLIRVQLDRSRGTTNLDIAARAAQWSAGPRSSNE